MIVSHKLYAYLFSKDKMIRAQYPFNEKDNIQYPNFPYSSGSMSCTALFPDLQMLCLPSSNTESFEIFHFDTNILDKTERKFKSYFSLLCSCFFGKSIYVLLLYDGTVRAWEFSDKFEKTFHNYLYRVNHHLAQAVDVTASEELSLVISCDIHQTIIISDLYTGVFIRSFIIQNSNITRILLLNEGFIVVFSNIKKEKRSLIQLYSLNGDLIFCSEFESEFACICPIEFIGPKSQLAVCFQNRTLLILTCPFFEKTYDQSFGEIPSAICFHEKSGLLLVGTENGSLFSIKVELS